MAFQSTGIGVVARGVRRCALALCCGLAIALVAGTAAQPALARFEDTTGYMNQRFVQPTWVKVRSEGRKRTVKIGKYLKSRSRTARRSSAKGVKVAALGKDAFVVPQPKTAVTGNGIRWVASEGCLNGSLVAVIHQVASAFGPVTVNSTCRSRRHNARVGGARRSHHLSGEAVDFRVHGNVGAVYAYLRSSGLVGGLKHYGGGLFHIDTGARRSW